jgi:hypothetical protein
VKVRDTTALTLVAPTDLTVEATSAEGAVVSFQAATATDLVTASPVISLAPASGAQLPLGTTTITVTATDAAENTATEMFRVTVGDTTAPKIQCPANVEVTAADASGATVTLPVPVVLDAVTAAPRVTFDYAQQSTYPVGSTKMVATATDAAGNSATCELEVKVSAASKPVKEGGSRSASGSTLGELVVLGLALMQRRVRHVVVRGDGGRWPPQCD